jgi:GNAT superfamily N-acetyltransferase
VGRNRTPEQNRSDKRARVHEGRAHAALVYDGPDCVGWCQFGSTEELPRIKNLRVYREGLVALPDWRITCFFVDRTRRHRGVAKAALQGAIEQIAQGGGGVVEAYPEDLEGRKASGSFLWSGSLSMFEQAGFTRERRIGKHAWVVRQAVDAG